MSSKVIILEDDQDLRSMVQEILEFEGLEVHGFETGQSALSHMKENSLPQVLLMDLKLPDMSPLDLQAEFNLIPGSEKVALIVASGNSQLETWAQKLNALTTLKKPYDMDILTMTVMSVLDSLNVKS